MDDPKEVVINVGGTWATPLNWQYNAYQVYENKLGSPGEIFLYGDTEYTRNADSGYGSYSFKYGRIEYKIYSRNMAQGDDICILRNLSTRKKRLIGRREKLLQESSKNPKFEEKSRQQTCRNCLKAIS